MKNIFKLLLINLILVPLLSCASALSYKASESEQQMTEALLRNDIQRVKALLSGGASPNSRMPAGGAYVLSIPLSNNNLEMARLLVDAGADVNMKDRYGMPLLHLAKQAPMIKLMLENGADMYAVYNNATAYELFATRLVTTEADKRKFIAQLRAQKLPKNVYDNAVRHAENSSWITKQDIINVVHTYRDFNYDVNRKFGENQQSLLFAAAFAENYELLSAVITGTDADVNIRDKWNASILNIITQSNITNRSAAEYETLLSQMMKKGLLIDAECANELDEKATALMIAAHKNYYDRLRALIKAGANPATVNENRKAAINFARDLRIVKFLIESGADPLNKDKWQQTALYFQKDPAVIALLLSRGININDQNINGETALFSVREPKVVEYLVSKGINMNHLNKKKQSVIEADISLIMHAMKFDKDLQDEFIPKFRTLIKLGINRTHLSNAYKMATSAKSYDLRKVIACLKPYA